MNARLVPLINVRGGFLLGIALTVLWLAINASPAMAQPGGPVFISGDDADAGGHCQGTACGGLYAALLSEVVSGSTSPGTGIVAIGVNSSSALIAFDSWNLVANGGPGAPVTHVTTVAGIGAINFPDFEAIYIPSTSIETAGGITFDQTEALNGRQADIESFVNISGGGLLALTGSPFANRYGWLPLTLSEINISHFGPDILPTADLQAIVPGITGADLNHGCCYHTAFTGPVGFSGLDVLAFHDDELNGVLDDTCQTVSSCDPGLDHVLILGGADVVLTGAISLDPLVATNDVGTDHTVTATIVDSDGMPFVGDLVTFEVLVGSENAGAAGTCSVNVDCTSDTNGQVSFTYTSNGNPGTDTIQASFTNGTGVLRLTTATKTWEVPAAGDTTPPRCDVIGVVAGDLHVEVEDTGDGLKEINVLVADNATVDVAPFAVGTNDVVLVMGIKIDGGSPATIRIEAIDNSPDMNRSECDPVLVSLTSEEPTVPSRQTFSGIPGADRYVTLYTEGPAFSLVTVNGTWTTVLTDARVIDIGSALIDGQDNTVTLWSLGVDGSVMFSDVMPSNATGHTTAYRSSWEDPWAPY